MLLKNNTFVSAIINSRDRESGTQSSFRFKLNKTIRSVNGYQIKNLQIPFSFYYINSTRNTLIVNFDGSDQTINIDTGHYSGPTMGVELQTKLNNLPGSGNFIVNFDIDKLTFSISNNTAFSIRSYDDDNQSTLAESLGFKDSSVFTTNSTNTIGDDHALLTYSYILLKSKFLSRNSLYETLYTNDIYRDTICYIPILVSPGGIINISEEKINVFPDTIDIEMNQEIDFSLEDEDGNEVELNGLDWNAEFCFIIS